MALQSPIWWKKRADLSQFLIHLTKDGNFEEFEPKPGPPPGYQKVHKRVSAKKSLEDILTNQRIEARSPFGYFKLRLNLHREYWWGSKVYDNGGADPNWIKAVCFSEAPLSELKDFYNLTTQKRNQYKKYGIAFWQEEVRMLGGNPIFYVDSRRADFLNALNESQMLNQTAFEPIMHLFETFGPPVIPAAGGYSDFTWEREWRKRGDLNFEWDAVAFGICSQSEIPHFQSLTQNSVLFLDPDWDLATLTNYLKIMKPELLDYI